MKTLAPPFRTAPLLLLLGFLSLTLTTVLPACKHADVIGLENATNLSTSLVALMNKADKSTYAENQTAIEDVGRALGRAEQHASEQKRNKAILEQWRTLSKDLVQPFLDRWNKEGKLSKAFVKESVTQVQKSLDAIKKAEQAKK